MKILTKFKKAADHVNLLEIIDNLLENVNTIKTQGEITNIIRKAEFEIPAHKRQLISEMAQIAKQYDGVNQPIDQKLKNEIQDKVEDWKHLL